MGLEELVLQVGIVAGLLVAIQKVENAARMATTVLLVTTAIS